MRCCEPLEYLKNINDTNYICGLMLNKLIINITTMLLFYFYETLIKKFLERQDVEIFLILEN